jgi:hypothetical protein
MPPHYIVAKFEIPFSFGLSEGIYVVRPEMDFEAGRKPEGSGRNIQQARFLNTDF